MVHARVRSVGLLLFFSGMCALVFQVTWQREFRLVFGGSTAASGAVLAVFMGGLGIGNLWLGRWADRRPNPLTLYAGLEFSVALSAAATPALLALVRSAYIALGGQTALGMAGATALRLGLSAAVLGLPTFLMGGTLPAAARAVTTPADSNRRGLGMLYGLNTLGAVAGAAASTFWLLETFGMRRTLWLACLVNLGIAGIAAAMARRIGRAADTKGELGDWGLGIRDWGLEPGAEGTARAARNTRFVVPPSGGSSLGFRLKPVLRTPATSSRAQCTSVSPRWFIFFSAAVVGFAFFLMELVWFRMLAPILGGTTFTFGLILAVALLGIGLGGAIYPLLFRRWQPSFYAFALTCGLEALAVAAPFFAGDRLAILTALLRERADTFAELVLGWAVVAGIVILPAAIASGVQFPLLVGLLGRAERAVGRDVGAAFAWNTLGAIAGSLAGGFGILPWLSAPGAWSVTAAILGSLGLAATVLSAWREHRRAALVVPAGVIVGAAILLGGPGPTAAWRHSGIGAGRATLPERTPNAWRNWTNEWRRAVAWEADGVETSVALLRQNGWAFIVNGKSDGNAIGDAATQIGPALVGGVLHRKPKTALVVGLGTGETAGWLADLPSMDRVDVVELEPAIDKVAEVCAAVNRDVLRHPKVRRLCNDGREVLLTASQPYDLIVSEPSNPYRAGVASLYTREYYAAARARLPADGLFLQWFQAYEVDEPTVRIVLATLHSVFPHVALWQTRSRDMLLVCSPQAVRFPLDRQREKLRAEPLKTALALAWREADLEGFLAHYLASPGFVEEYCQEQITPWNTDDRNLLEYGVARTVGRRGGFAVEELRARAVAGGRDRPATEEGNVDWDIVETRRLGMHAIFGGAVPLHDHLSEGQRSRGEALNHYLAGDYREAIRTWESQPRDCVSPIEMTAMAHAYAQVRSRKALEWAERIRAFSPTEAQAVTAIFLGRRGQAAESAAAAESVFHDLRTNPWPSAQLITALFATAIETAKRDPAQADRLYRSLQEPFGVMLLEDKRRAAEYALARRLGPEAIAACLESMEPNIPWKLPVLEQRLEAYTALKHPLAAKAEADLLWYRKHER
jgi:predicted membrane-bound spermidine synthase